MARLLVVRNLDPRTFLEEIAERCRSDPECGSIQLYLGIVKRIREGMHVEKLLVEPRSEDLEYLRRFVEENCLGIDCVTVVREGELAPGEPLLLIAIAARTRREALESLARILEEMKRVMAGWKREFVSM